MPNLMQEMHDLEENRSTLRDRYGLNHSINQNLCADCPCLELVYGSLQSRTPNVQTQEGTDPDTKQHTISSAVKTVFQFCSLLLRAGPDFSELVKALSASVRNYRSSAFDVYVHSCKYTNTRTTHTLASWR